MLTVYRITLQTAVSQIPTTMSNQLQPHFMQSELYDLYDCGYLLCATLQIAKYTPRVTPYNMQWPVEAVTIVNLKSVIPAFITGLHVNSILFCRCQSQQDGHKITCCSAVLHKFLFRLKNELTYYVFNFSRTTGNAQSMSISTKLNHTCNY